MSKPQLLREILAQKTILKVMGGHSALGAKLIEKNGFDGVWASGLELATAHGVPDANVLTMTENLEAAADINDATSLPVLADCDTGYGNAMNVMHMVRRYEAAGIAAVVIEDKRFPKINSFIPGRQELASIGEFAGKIEAARSARASSDGVMIFARVESLIAGLGMEETFRRALAYYEAGAEGMVIHSKAHTPEEVFTFARLWKEKMGSLDLPLIAIPTTYPKVTAEQLAEAGFKIVIYANHGIRAAVRRMNEIFRRIQKEGSSKSIEEEIASLEEIFQMQGMPDYQEQEKRYSHTREKVSAVIPAAHDHRFQPELDSHLQDQPLCMLKVGGRSLLERQLDLLRSAGIEDFKVVTGYRQEKIQVQGVQKVTNSEYAEKGSAHSLMKGLETGTGKTLVSYSDIIFDRQIPEALLKSPYPITLVIDRAFRTLPRRDKILDLVMTEETKGRQEVRKIKLEPFKKISRIGKKLDPKKADHEFIGMMLLSKEGLEDLKKAWREALGTYARQPFYEAPDAGRASVTDLLQYVIDRGTTFFGLVIEHGWSEIYSLDDYVRVDSYFSGETPERTMTSSVSE